MRPGEPRDTDEVIGAPIDRVDTAAAADRILAWAKRRESRVVCVCNVHSVATARLDPSFARILAASDMNTADGAPVAWSMGAGGRDAQERVDGPGLMWRACALAAERGQSIYLYGATDETLALLGERLRAAFPALVIAGASAPPFREPTAAEDAADVAAINRSGAGIVWVGLGCPKQERWMMAHRGRVNAVMVGVGAAFDYHAGTLQRAPVWMRERGLEWLHRLSTEPRRLFWRYATTNSVFVWYTLGGAVLGWAAQAGLVAKRRRR